MSKVHKEKIEAIKSILRIRYEAGKVFNNLLRKTYGDKNVKKAMAEFAEEII